MSKLQLVVIALVILALVLAGVGLGVAFLETKTLQGTVQDVGGAAVPQAAVTLAGRSTFADDRGFFELQFPRGVWQVRVFADGYEGAQREINAADLWTQSFTAQLELQPRAWRGRVLDAKTQEPLPGTTVRVGEQRLETDAQGEFVVLGIRNGTNIQIERPGYRAVTVTVAAAGSSSEPTILALPPAETRIRVVDATTHKPLPGVRVSANGQAVVTEADGQVVLRGLAQGMLVSAQLAGYAKGTIQLDGAEQLTLPLQPSLLRGHVVSPQTQAAVADAVVLMANSDGAILSALQTDAQGNFTLEDFTQSPRLYVKKPGYQLAAFDIEQGGARDLPLTPFKARGIHLYYGISRADTERVLDAFKGTDLNAVVFDVKEDPGFILWDSKVPLAQQIGAYVERDYTASDQVETCRTYKLYCIARVTVFKDNLLARNRPDLALHDAAGGLLYENAAYWTDPAARAVQDYHIGLARELAAMGFDEIQFDYIRYPGTQNVLASEFGDARSRVSTIAAFLERAQNALRQTPAFFSGDVFGLTTATDDEQGIGQVWEAIAPYFDYISPMMYPSTWRYATNLWGGGFGITDCADAYACPYEIVRYGTVKARARTSSSWTLVRPWIQAYGMNLEQMLAQARGADDADSAGYLFWNNQGLYPGELFGQR